MSETFEAHINELRARRQLLETKTKKAQEVLDEYKAKTIAHATDMYQKLKLQTAEARARNAQLLEEISLAASAASAIKIEGGYPSGMMSAKENLRNAKQMYLRSVEYLLPSWRRQMAAQVEEEVKSLRQEKAAALLRRQRMAVEMEREERQKEILEKERRQLVLALALERRDQAEAAKREALRAENARAADEGIIFEVMHGDSKSDVAATELFEGVQNNRLVERLEEIDKQLNVRFSNSNQEFNSSNHSGNGSGSVSPRQGSSLQIQSPSRDVTNISESKERSSLSSSSTSPKYDIPSSPSLLRQASPQGSPREMHGSPFAPSSDARYSQHSINSSIFQPTEATSPQRNSPLLSSEDTNVSSMDIQPISPKFASSLLPRSPRQSESPLSSSASTMQVDTESDHTNTGESFLQNHDNAVSTSVFADVMDSIKDLSLNDAIKVVQSLFLRIERNVYASNAGDSDRNPYASTTSHSIDRATLQFVARAALMNRDAEVDAYSSWHWAGSVLLIFREKGGELLSIDALNGVVSLDRLHKEQKRRGESRAELWNALIAHLQRLEQSHIIDGKDLVGIFTPVLIDFVSESTQDEGEKKRLGRKVGTLLQQALMPAEEPSSQRSHAAPPPRSDKPPQQMQQQVANALPSPPPSASSLSLAKVRQSETEVTRNNKVAELEDDEIAGDEMIYKPPPLRDLAPDESTSSVGSIDKLKKASGRRWEESDEFDF